MTKKKFDIAEVHAEITDGLIALMESGVAPWSKPWIVRGRDDAMRPRNGISNRVYTGFNSMYLSFLVEQNSWNDPRFYTMNSLGEGMQVKKGSKSTMVIYNKATKRDVEDESTGEVETKTSWFQRYYRVFNGSQIDGIDTFELPEVEVEGYDHEHDEYGEAQLISAEWCDTLGGGLHHGGDRACYTPDLDRIDMPDLDQFESLEAYYHTMFHEMAHSTGHKSRTNRLDNSDRGGEARVTGDNYAKEELIAEFASAFMCANTGVPLDDSQSAAYLKSWAKRCKAEPKLLFSAANAASYAADMIMENTYAVA